MTTQLLVSPEKIESELTSIWEKLGKEKTRASLFNLIVFTRYSERTDYFRSIVDKIIDKFPCRILFISEDPDSTQHYLKTAVSVATPKEKESSVACDQIDIGVAGAELNRVPYVLLPHILPDLPVTLLWAEDPTKAHPLFPALAELADRIIFDSESSDSLLEFAKTVLSLSEQKRLDVADLNWARTEGWRDFLAFVFDTPQRLEELRDLFSLQMVYNARPTQFFCHLKIQSMYLLSWLAVRLDWKIKKATPQLQFEFEELKAAIGSATWDNLGPGTVISLELSMTNGHLFQACRIPDRPHSLAVQISSQEKCELPYEFMLGQTATGHSLVQEICRKGTSNHYLEMLKLLTQLDKDRLC